MKIFALAGLTATHKTTVALLLCEYLNAEIISCDSVQVYKYLDIGSNKPIDSKASTMHHMINIVDPWETYNAHSFLIDAHQHIKEIHQRQKNVLLVGGTMLYFKLLTQGFNALSLSKDKYDDFLEHCPKYQLINIYQQYSHLLDEYFPRFKDQNLDVLDDRKILRRVKIIAHLLTQKNVGFISEESFPPLTIPICAFYAHHRHKIYVDVKCRLDSMIKQGLIDEVKHIITLPKMHKHTQSMQSIGYKQACLYLEGIYPYVEFYDKTLTATRHLVKKQSTWINNWHSSINIIDNDLSIEQKVSSCLKYFVV